jgi:ectoine hydroxylase-related dioxygenase (phytanoyl-CoA dioxygenase family)
VQNDAVIVDAGRRERYETDGSFRIDGFVAPSVGQVMLEDVVGVARRAAAGEDIRPALVLPEAQRGFSGTKPEDFVSKVFRLHRRPLFREFLESPAVVAVVTEMLGPNVDCFLSQFIFKNPGAWGQPWHQDSYYFPFTPARPIVGLWLAVTEATLENGCLHVMPGSHREPVHEHVPDRRPNANYGYVEIVDHDMTAAMPVLLQPGDLLVFDSHLMHRSTDNVSTGIRAAMVFHCCVAGTRELETSPTRSLVQDFAPLVRDGAVEPA